METGSRFTQETEPQARRETFSLPIQEAERTYESLHALRSLAKRLRAELAMTESGADDASAKAGAVGGRTKTHEMLREQARLEVDVRELERKLKDNDRLRSVAAETLVALVEKDAEYDDLLAALDPRSPHDIH